MNPALWGGLSALSWGTADFAARFSSRAIGHASALFGMLAVGSVVLSLWVWLAATPLTWEPSGYWLLAVTGVGTMVATLLLYRGLARGPVSIVAPIVAGYPVLVVLFWYLAGAEPTPVQWAAMAVTVAGALIVARSARRFEEPGKVSRAELRTTVLIAAGASLGFAVLVFTAQLAVPVYGEVQTLWLSRLIALASLSVLFLARAQRPSLPLTWWPLLAAQGLLDGGGYLFLLAGSAGEAPEIAAVTASAFGAVTTVLARVVLREAMSALQWGGIALVFAGVAVLSAAG